MFVEEIRLPRSNNILEGPVKMCNNPFLCYRHGFPEENKNVELSEG